jgi:MoaA/NifB/PqqE/SkfB family radical SAM enzyme
MYDYKKINKMHLEVSSLCNAECPVCNRRAGGGPKNPVMIERCISLDDFKAWFPVDFLTQLRQLTLCGNYGDPMTAPDLIPILTYFRELNPTASVSMNTNASGRDKKFWEDLSEVIGKFGRVVFSVDGLEDTNHLYRKGTNWKKIMTAMTSFISTKKSTAVWEFLVFKHNQHQISEARELAKELGIIEFWAKKAMGFGSTESSTGEPTIRTLNIDGTFAYNLYAPDDEWKNEILKKKRHITKHHQRDHKINEPIITLKGISYMFDYNVDLSKSLTTFDAKEIKKLDECEIKCEALAWNDDLDQGIFVSSTGLLFPCCFTGSKYYASASFETVQFRKFIESYGEDTINLNKTNSIKDALDSDLMQHGYVNSWAKSSIQEGKLYTCGTFCGKNTNTEIKSTKKSTGHDMGTYSDV